jgi:hypothetical protein
MIAPSSHRQDRKGQVGVEALIVIGLIISIMTVVFFGLHQRNVENERIRDILTAQEQVDRLAGVINQGAVSGSGFQKNTTLKQNIGGFNISSFKVRNTSRVVAVQWTGIGDRKYRVTSSLLTSKVNSHELDATRITVKNVNGTIEITEHND